MELHSDSTPTKSSETTYIITTLTHIFVSHGLLSVLHNCDIVSCKRFFNFIWRASGLDSTVGRSIIPTSYADNVCVCVRVCVLIHWCSLVFALYNYGYLLHRVTSD